LTLPPRRRFEPLKDSPLAQPDIPPDLQAAPPNAPDNAARPGTPHGHESLEWKAILLLGFLLALLLFSAAYVMYARGLFESTQKLVLVAEDSEGVGIGMNLTFSGFPIGRVKRIELAPDGKARIVVDVASKDAHWLRTSSVFTLVKGLVGGTSIRAYTGLLSDPPLPPDAVRTVLQGDAAGEIPKLVAAAKDLIENLNTLTGSEGALGASLGNLQTLTKRLNGKGGALTVLLGGEAEAQKLMATLDRTNALLARADGIAARADAQLLGDKTGKGGVVGETRATVAQLNLLLGDARNSLKKVDAVLVEAQAVGANAKEATNELGNLRGEVEASLRKVDGLVNEINRKWPFKRDGEVRLP
jgi:phospholipid/cholesterol/gamma-HCH transport system substrate-binding protein